MSPLESPNISPFASKPLTFDPRIAVFWDDSRMTGLGHAFRSLPTEPGRKLRGNVQLLAWPWPWRFWENMGKSWGTS